MTVLLTRPHIDNLFMSKVFARHNIKTVSAPLLTIAYKLPLDLDYTPYQGGVITSQHSLPGLQNSPKDFPLFIVGDATTEKAKELGFVNIRSAHGDGTDLANLIKQECPDISKPLLYPAGKFVKPTVIDCLNTYIIHKHPVYEALPVTDWPEAVLENIRNGNITWICLFSDRSAQTLRTILRENSVQKYMRTISLCSFSTSISSIVQDVQWQSTVTCPHPDMVSFWEIVDAKIFRYTRDNYAKAQEN